MANASMKGGRTAPRNWQHETTAQQRFYRFNEGGADCPPKPYGALVGVGDIGQASMKGGRTAPRNLAIADEVMRRVALQ